VSTGAGVEDLATDEVLVRVLADHPDVLEQLRAAHDAAWASVDPVLLELCRLRVASLLGCAAEAAARTPAAADAGLDEAATRELAAWPSSPRFDERQRAVLALCEQFVVDVASVDEALTGPVRAHLGDRGLATLTSALLVIEQRQRLRLAWERLHLVPERAGGAAAPAVQAGAPAELRRALGAWQAAVVRLDRVDPYSTELVRLRCANHHACRT